MFIMCITTNYRLVFSNKNNIIVVLKNLTKYGISISIIIIISFLFDSLFEFGKKKKQTKKNYLY